MSALTAFFVYTQALGALGGALAAVWGEIVYVRAVADDCVSAAERHQLNVIAASLRYGMGMMLLSSLALVIISYRSGAALQPALTGGYWLFMIISLGVVYVAKRLAEGRIAHLTGSAVLFSAWWFLAYLSFGLVPALPFGALVALYVFASVVLFGVLQYVRSFFIHT